MYSFKNPNYINEDQARFVKYKNEIETYIAALPSNIEFVGFDKLRSDILEMNLPGVVGTDLTEYKLRMLCQQVGFETLEADKPV